MSSYIIAGSADSLDTAYCQEIARRIKAKYKNIDFRIVIKHPSQWEQYLQQICRIYGFLNKSNPIVYTFDGKIIGNKDAFMSNASKYFGLQEESLNVENLSTKVNMKQAEQQLQRKKIIKNNIKTMNEKIENTYQSLLKKKVLKHQLQEKEEFLNNGIQYQFRQVPGLCKDMVFIKDKKVDIVVEEVKPQQIDLMALSLNDQIKPDQPVKQAFVTSKENQQLDQKMSQASKTNKLHQSMMSYDNNSKGMKQSSSKQKSRIDQQFDDLADYVDHDMSQVAICQLSDNFNLAFERDSHIQGEMVLYHNQDPNANIMRIYNLGRPVKGHKPMIFDIPSQQFTQEHPDIPSQQQIQTKQTIQLEHKEEQSKKQQNHQQQKVGEQTLSEDKQKGVTPSGDTPSGDTPSGDKQPKKHKLKVQQKPALKSKTQPNVQRKQSFDDQKLQILSQRGSQLNLISNLNYHTLMIAHPLSFHEVKAVLNLIKQSNSIATLQFLPDNPNPRIKVYSRYFLTNDKNGLLPIQKYINKQLQQQQYKQICLNPQQQIQIAAFQINQISFNHLYYKHNHSQLNEQLQVKVIRYAVKHMLQQQDKVRKQIGYNMIIAKNFSMFVPLVHPYRQYNKTDLYLDGLSFLGFINVAKVAQPFKNKQRGSFIDKKQLIKDYLARSTNYIQEA